MALGRPTRTGCGRRCGGASWSWRCCPTVRTTSTTCTTARSAPTGPSSCCAPTTALPGGRRWRPAELAGDTLIARDGCSFMAADRAAPRPRAGWGARADHRADARAAGRPGGPQRRRRAARASASACRRGCAGARSPSCPKSRPSPPRHQARPPLLAAGQRLRRLGGTAALGAGRRRGGGVSRGRLPLQPRVGPAASGARRVRPGARGGRSGSCRPSCGCLAIQCRGKRRAARARGARPTCQRMM